MHCIHQAQALLNTTLLYDGFNIPGDVHKTHPLRDSKM